MKCPHCGADLAERLRFCRFCGTGLEEQSAAVAASGTTAGRCSACGAVLKPGARFCKNCGTLGVSADVAEPVATCLHCGVPRKTDRKFCSSCGKAYEESADTSVLRAATAAATQPGKLRPTALPPKASRVAPTLKSQRAARSPRPPINWKKVAVVVGIPGVFASAAFAAWVLLPRDLLAPQRLRITMQLPSAATAVGFVTSPTSSFLVATIPRQNSTGVEIWDAGSGEAKARAETPAVPLVSPDGQTAVWFYPQFFSGLQLVIRNLRTTKERNVPLSDPAVVNQGNGGQRVPNWAAAMAFDSTGGMLATAHVNGSLHLWDLSSGKLQRTLRKGGDIVLGQPGNALCRDSSLAFSSDDSLLAAGETNGNVVVWETRTGRLAATLEANPSLSCDTPSSIQGYAVTAVGFSPGDRLVAVGDASGTIRVWQVASRQLLLNLPAHTGAVTRVAFSPDARSLISSSRRWNVDQNRTYTTYLIFGARDAHLFYGYDLAGTGSFSFTSGGDLLLAQLADAKITVEDWSMPSRLRLPFMSSGVSDSALNSLQPLYEDAALRNLDLLQQMLSSYRLTNGAGSTFPKGLQAIQAQGLPTALVLKGDYQGYHFSYVPAPSEPQGQMSSYTLSAHPLRYRQTGTRSFLTDQTGAVHSCGDDRVALAKDPVTGKVFDATQASAALTPSQAPASQGTPFVSPVSLSQAQPTDYVRDFANVLDANTITHLNDICRQVDQKAHAQIAVVTVNSLDGSDIESYAADLFKRWGVGSKTTNRGVLILLAVHDRRYRIEVSEGLEPILPNGRVGGFGSEAVPLLRNNDYAGALLQVTSRVADVIAKDSSVELTGESAPGQAVVGMEQAGRLLSQAETQFRQGEYKLAQQTCDAALRLDPNNAVARQLKAKIEETIRVLGNP